MYAGFIRPGKHSIVIKDLDYNCHFYKQIAVDLRNYDLEISNLTRVILYK